MKRILAINLIPLICVTIPILTQGIKKDSFGMRVSDFDGRRISSERTLLVKISDFIEDVRYPHEKFSYFPFLSGEEFLIDTNVVYFPAPSLQWSPSVAFGGTNYLVVWQHGAPTPRHIYGARVDTSGEVLDKAGTIISTAGSDPVVAFDGTNYFVVWEGSGIRGSRVDTSGTVLDTAGITISTGACYYALPSIAFDGINYLVVWADIPGTFIGIYGARVSQSGTVLDTEAIAIGSAESLLHPSPSVAFDGTNYLVVWSGGSGGAYDIYGARVIHPVQYLTHLSSLYVLNRVPRVLLQ